MLNMSLYEYILYAMRISANKYFLQNSSNTQLYYGIFFCLLHLMWYSRCLQHSKECNICSQKCINNYYKQTSTSSSVQYCQCYQFQTAVDICMHKHIQRVPNCIRTDQALCIGTWCMTHWLQFILHNALNEYETCHLRTTIAT